VSTRRRALLTIFIATTLGGLVISAVALLHPAVTRPLVWLTIGVGMWATGGALWGFSALLACREHAHAEGAYRLGYEVGRRDTIEQMNRAATVTALRAPQHSLSRFNRATRPRSAAGRPVRPSPLATTPD